MAELLKLISPSAPNPEPGQYIETETAADILFTLEGILQHSGKYVGLIAGAPGVGKTEAIWRFKQTKLGARVFIHEAAAGEGGIWHTACELCNVLGTYPPNAKRLSEERRRIAETVGAGAMLIIDSAQSLVQRNPKGRDNWETFEWLRFMAAEGMFSLVLCGDLTLCELETLSPPLWSRVRRPTIITRSPKADVLAIAHQWGITDKEAIDLLANVARRGGALRRVVTVCEDASDKAGHGAAQIAHVLAALEDLKLDGRTMK